MRRVCASIARALPSGTTSIILSAALMAAGSQEALGQEAPPAASKPIVFVNVNTIRMEDDRVDAAQTVVVHGARIAAVGPAGAIRIPADAVVIQGGGRYLTPGLTDAHVHLEGDGMRGGASRPDFGDAPLYLAHGVTTVINLRGLPVHLEWRRRIENGDLLGPTIYTSGEFVNEPRVTTGEEVQRDIAAQVRAGYDVIKFHEVFTRDGSATTAGLSLAAYRTMIETARELGVPLIGHAPVNLGLDALLSARQPIAHLGMLSNVYFLPLAANRGWLFVTSGAIFVLLALGAWSGGAAIVRRWRAAPPLPPAIARIRVLLGFQVAAVVAAVACAALSLPSGPMFQSAALRLAFTASAVFSGLIALALLRRVVRLWRDPSMPALTRVHPSATLTASAAFALAALVFWTPVVWRSSDRGIQRLAHQLRAADIPVQTTLVVYDAIGGPRHARLTDDPSLRYVRADTRARWGRGMPAPPGYRYTDFMKRVAGTLHHAGVPLMVGTDAMGYPLVTPGSSMHHELALLTDGGLSPYEAIRAATVVPARFLRREHEFGTIAVGKRADLLLVDGNPLADISRLARPAGVMARGRWFPREALAARLEAMK